MAVITKIGTIVKQFVKLEKASAHEQHKMMYSLFKTITDGSGKPSSLVFEGKYLEELPESIKPFLAGLKKPRVIIGAKSSEKGQGILGFVIKDGNKTKGRAALGVDKTRGELPVVQLRGSLKNSEDTVLSFNSMHNPNVPLDSENAGIFTGKMSGGKRLSTRIANEHRPPAFIADTYINPELAKAEGIPSAAIKELTAHQKLKPEDINKMRLNLTSFIKNKGHKIYSINECLDDAVKIAQWEGKPTIESVIKAKNILLKKMGYNPDKVKINVNTKSNFAMSYTNPTGELNIHPVFLEQATHQDVVVVLSHELTHMEDFVKLYKKIGPEEFEKLTRPKALVPADTPQVNHKWYKEMSKLVDENDWKFHSGLVKTEIKNSDGTTKVINHLKFDYKSMIKEFQDKINFAYKKYKGVYREIKAAEMYQFSAIESRAKLVEKNLVSKLEEAGILQKTKFSDMYGTGAYTSLGTYTNRFAPLDKELGKLYGNKKSQKFDELFYEEFSHSNKRIAELHKKITSPDGATEEEAKELDRLIENSGGIQNVYSKIIYKMAEKLGVNIPD